MKGNWKRFDELVNRYALLFHIPLAMLLVLVNESLSRHSVLEGFGFIVGHTGPFLYNSYIVYVILLLVFLSPRRLFMRLVMMAIVILFGIINCIILNNRVTPFGFTDLAMIGDLLTMQNTKYFTAQQAGISLIAILVFVFLMVMLHMHSTKKQVKTKLWVRLLICGAGIVSLLPVTKIAQRAGVVQTYFGNLAQGYLDNGYTYGFAMSVVGRGMNQPSGYSEEAVQKIIADTEKGNSTLGEVRPNIIVVLLESAFDVNEYPDLTYNEDPLPYFHDLEQNYSTGHLTVPVVGAGTCNTEFEILTGMSCKFFGPGEYPQKTVLKKRDCESTADVIKKLGYGTHVVHNNGGNFYSRANAFSQMGFDTFTSKELLDITEYTPLNTWPTDDILVGATKDALDSTTGPDYCYTITVGTHGDYPTEKVIEDPKITVEVKGVDEGRQNQWEYYCNMLRNMDRFLKEYTDMLSKRGEPTLLICFGDHLPTMGLSDSDVTQKDVYQTKYITWNNFGMEKEDADLTSYQLVSEYFDRLGIHGGTIVDYDQTMTEKGVVASSQTYLRNLQMLQYDLLYGQRYAYHGVDMYPASDLVMGILPVKINEVYYYDDKLHIFGENFTPWSRVYVNGEKVTTTYESGQVLSINARDIADSSYIVVNQLGSNNTIFRSSNEYQLQLPQAAEN